MSDGNLNPKVVLLEKCLGLGPTECTDVLFTGRPGEPSANIVYFGGDLQDLPTEMMKHDEGREYVHWNLESTAQLLQKRFSTESGWTNPHVWVIRPSHWVSQIFAAYNTFLPFDEHTVPQIDHNVSKLGALEQLSAVLRTAVARLREIKPSYVVHLGAPLCLVGFSKGCTVLIQLLYELAYCSQFVRNSVDSSVCNPTSPTQELLSKLKSLYWLDGGHSGIDNQWPTASTVLSRLDPTKVPKMFVFGTPYQLMDSRRPWKSRDYHRFLELLHRYDLPHNHGILSNNLTGFPVAKATLESHFNLLEQFPIETSF